MRCKSSVFWVVESLWSFAHGIIGWIPYRSLRLGDLNGGMRSHWRYLLLLLFCEWVISVHVNQSPIVVFARNKNQAILAVAHAIHRHRSHRHTACCNDWSDVKDNRSPKWPRNRRDKRVLKQFHWMGIHNKFNFIIMISFRGTTAVSRNTQQYTRTIYNLVSN